MCCDEQNDEGEEDGDDDALAGTLVERLLARHEAPVVLGVDEGGLEALGCLFFGKIVDEAHPSLVNRHLLFAGVSRLSVSQRLDLHCDQFIGLLVEA